MNRATLAVGVVLLVGFAVGLTGQTLDGLAELHVQKIVLDPPSVVTRGEDVQIYARITNTGARTAERFTVGFFYREAREGEPWQLLEQTVEEHLRPSQQDFREVTHTFNTLDWDLGTFEIKVVADVSNQIPEIDELNNELTTSMRLVTSTLGLPELQPIGMTFEPLSAPDAGKWEVRVEVVNLGVGAQSFFKVQFFIEGLPFDPAYGETAASTKVVPSAGQSVEISGVLNPAARNLEPGTYQITAQIDVDEQVAEQDEGNNTLSAWLTVMPVELHPVSISFDLPVVRLDEEVRVTSTIVNDGEGIARTVPVVFLINGLRFASVQLSQLGSEPQQAAATLNADRLGLIDAPKIYEISVIVDPDDTLSELDEANNEMVRTLTILPSQPRKAELHPESLILSPASPAEQGRADVVTVSSVVRNTGRAASGPFDVGFYYRVKGGRRWDPFPCSDPASCNGIELAAGGDATLVGSLPVRALPPGIYEIRVVADAGAAVDELDEGNNELQTTLTLLASRLPDLTVCRLMPLSIEPSVQVQKGQTIHLTACITNNGDLDAGPFPVQFSYCHLTEATTPEEATCIEEGQFITAYFDPTPPIVVPGLAIGETTNVEIDLETVGLAPGRYSIRVAIDPPSGGDAEGVVKERNEANNLVAGQVFVLGADLHVVGAQAQWVPVDEDEDGEVDRELVEVQALIRNSGVLPAGQFVVGFYVTRIDPDGADPLSCGQDPNVLCGPGPRFGEVSLHGLDVNTEELVACRLDPEALGLVPGNYILGVYVDADEQVAEHFELNNMLEIAFELPEEAGGPGGEPGADLAVLSLFARRSTTSPDDLRVWATLTNIGVADAGTFEVAFYYTPLGDPDPVFSVASVSALAVGETVTLLRSFDATGLAAGRYDVGVIVDPEDAIPETDEDNNAQETELRLY